MVHKILLMSTKIKKNNKVLKMETIKLTADSVCIKQNDELGILYLFYTLAEDEAFEKLGEELFKAQTLEFSDENGNDPDEVEDWFFDHSKIADCGFKANEFYNKEIWHDDIIVECKETREAIVNGTKFVVSATASKDGMYKNREAQKMVELKLW